MPKQIIDYSKNIIYKLVCHDLNVQDIYVGHTTNFIKRKQGHKKACNNQNNTKHNLKVYKMIRDNGNWNNWSMIEIEKYPCNDKNEACARERYWYELLNANMNTLCPTFDKEKKKKYNKEYRDNKKENFKEHNKEYYEANKEDIIKKVHEYASTHKEEISKRNKNYREVHKEQIKARRSKVCICEICNRKYTHDHKARHERTKVHLNQITKS